MTRELDESIRNIRLHRKNRMDEFRNVDISERGKALLLLSPRIQKQVLSNLHDEEIIEALNAIDPDKATKLLRTLPSQRKTKILNQLGDRIRDKVDFLLRFDPNTAADLMNLDYVQVDPNSSFGEIKEYLQEHERLTGKFPTILAIDNGKIIGELPGHVLALFGSKEKVATHLKKSITVRYDGELPKVIDTFIKHPHSKIVVLDDDGSILGIIHSDDVLRYISKRSTRDLYGFAGVNREEDVLDSAWMKVKYRYKWLIINLGTAFMAAGVVGLFEDTISRVVLLAIYMPIVAGMGGNAGTQTLAVVVRGLVMKEVDLKTIRPVIINEVMAGAINGLINGVIVAVIAVVWNKNPIFGLVIGLAMVINLIIAGFFGAIIPVIMKSLKKDPASSATIFITTATDVFGFFTFLGLAATLL